ncbi:putative Glycosyltransferase fused with Polysaccharide deacetylase [Vibrio nigripulchritudo SFn27]|uniref:Putative Glycosyltransferase fused with Polysaccharide deacetylase n=1 Tax=Vibrio nigripulchritudo TaxID=28173 RepID=U4KFR5_9VIBR|nr:polysaccharide deacetylase family protein [Vibrio nigripulchritudo]CCN80401.1 putative Glycosyltransferase fused with Polysaccharide deacetylase [Vibrio nigripulchritudo BLFn1]CCN88388.1 putative Glycosyltransferase fused with Polysaccharide deacetylase [Vibrio nigripulchritudo SFn27]CCN92590.1 putative Glycosyltransferase fused with Polysaccharide deacetylase [Vibrio nigripulchritudo ENn2]CCO40977.1 putative Glycosyltransferase fused with Polysaccharide deacetylase [Vibrio nigripulchritudo 
MNILMALSQLEVTGAEVYATTVGDKLTELGHNVKYVSDTLTKPHKGEFFKLRFNKRSVFRRFWHVGYLIYLIKKHRIQLVHAHSRASSWSCHIACKLTNTPMVTTVHGRQPVHASRKRFHAMGDKALPVCEAIQKQLIDDLEVPEAQLEVSRNGINTSEFQWVPAPQNTKPVITIIGRLSGPKGDLCYQLLKECLDTDKYHVKVVTGSEVTERFKPFTETVEFTGYTNDVVSMLAQSDLVIGAGRVAMESLLCGRPTLAVGEASLVGLVNQENIKTAMSTNFGDIGPKDLDIDFTQVPALVEQAMSQPHCDENVSCTIRENYELDSIVEQLEGIYQDVTVTKLQKEMPIIMYHRFIRDDSEKGIHGTFMHIDMLEKHFQLIKKMGFETVTFEELKDKGFIHRLSPGKRFIMITVDDGFKDNHELLLPLLKKYNFKAVLYAVTGETYNRWDVEGVETPDRKVELMSREQLKEMSDSGLVEVGGHTLTHPKLSQLDEAQQRHEIKANKEELEALLGKSLTSFAYPYGDHNEDTKRISKELGYDFSVATNSGPHALHQDPYQIRRIAIFPRTDVFGLWRKIKGNYTFRKAK